jgi:oxysterol-binding protein 1
MATDKDNHKRSKSQIAKSLLSRVSSKTDVRDEDDNSLPPSRTSNVGSESSFTSSTPNLQARPYHSSSRSSRHRPHLSTTMSNTDRESANNFTPTPKSNPSANPPPSPTANSLEQSVKLFRLFEALRSGDTAAISKAIREQSSQDNGNAKVEGTTILHLAIQCAELPVIEFVLSNVVSSQDPNQGINAKDKDGNTPLHIAARLSRAPVVKLLLEQEGINDGLPNYNGQTPLDLAVAPDIFQQLQLARSLYIDQNVRKIQELVARRDYAGLEKMLTDERIKTTIDIDGEELPTDETTTAAGGTLLHEAARKRDHKLIQLLLLNGADPFKRDRKGQLPQNVTKDDKTKAILKRSPAAAAAQRGIQERTILGGAAQQGHGAAPGDSSLSHKESREMKGYLKKWTNYTSGWKLRWFVLEDGVLSYYKHQGRS